MIIVLLFSKIRLLIGVLNRLGCWIVREVSGYVEFVKNEWSAISIEGWGAFVLKEKLKVIKHKL